MRQTLLYVAVRHRMMCHLARPVSAWARAALLAFGTRQDRRTYGDQRRLSAPDVADSQPCAAARRAIGPRPSWGQKRVL